MESHAEAAELRAEIARRQVHRYELAARVGVHPGRLGQMLGGRLALPTSLAERIRDALEAMGHGD